MRSLYIQYERCQNVLLGADDIQCCVWLYAITPNLVWSESLKITWLHGCFNSSFSFSTAVTARQTPQSGSFSVRFSVWDGGMLHFLGLPKALIDCLVFPSEIPPRHRNAGSSAASDFAPVILSSIRHQSNTSSAIYRHSHLEALKHCFFFIFIFLGSYQLALDGAPASRCDCTSWSPESGEKNAFQGANFPPNLGGVNFCLHG